MNRFRIGTRRSPLALVQAEWVQDRIREHHPQAAVEIVPIRTSGDRFQNVPIERIGTKGVFIKEIEEALLRGDIDVAVHSMKDLPTELPEGLAVAAVPEREDPADVLVSRVAESLDALPAGARIGTGSLRRRAQLLHHRPDLAVVPIRGNVDTRIAKLARGEVDALVLALAGLKRLGRAYETAQPLPPETCMSAVAQGALGLETRSGEVERLTFLDHAPSALEVAAERAFLARLEGGCQVPVGARAVVRGDRLALAGMVAEVSGRQVFRGELSGASADAASLGMRLAERLLAEGAGAVLREARP
ncbi:MAG: hydroxymethylbilane synthase [Deltaproteobacteria bacterium]|nr:hydroxymethylbilane synthase [Deltaproteobacteria bacterium]